MDQIKYRDNLYVLSCQIGLHNDELPSEVILGVFVSVESAVGHFNETFGIYRPQDYVPFGDQDGSGLWVADDPFPGMPSAFIQEVQLSIIDATFASMALRHVLMAIRLQQQQAMIEQKASELLATAQSAAK